MHNVTSKSLDQNLPTEVTLKDENPSPCQFLCCSKIFSAIFGLFSSKSQESTADLKDPQNVTVKDSDDEDSKISTVSQETLPNKTDGDGEIDDDPNSMASQLRRRRTNLNKVSNDQEKPSSDNAQKSANTFKNNTPDVTEPKPFSTKPSPTNTNNANGALLSELTTRLASRTVIGESSPSSNSQELPPPITSNLDLPPPINSNQGLQQPNFSSITSHQDLPPPINSNQGLQQPNFSSITSHQDLPPPNFPKQNPPSPNNSNSSKITSGRKLPGLPNEPKPETTKNNTNNKPELKPEDILKRQAELAQKRQERQQAEEKKLAEKKPEEPTTDSIDTPSKSVQNLRSMFEKK